MKDILRNIFIVSLSVFLTSVSILAGATSETTLIKSKSTPDVYQYSPDPLPQIPMRFFYNQQHLNSIDKDSGHLVTQNEDFEFAVRDDINLSLIRYYDSGNEANGISGKGWTWSFESNISVKSDDAIELLGFDGKTRILQKEGLNRFVSYENGKLEIIKQADGYSLDIFNSKIKYRSDGKLSEIIGKNNTSIKLNYKGAILTAASLFDRAEVAFDYDKDSGLLKSIILPTGKKLDYEYNGKGQLSKAIDVTGQSIDYFYTSQGLLEKVSYYDYAEVSFAYKTDTAILKSITQPDNRVITYDYSEEINDSGKTKTVVITDGDQVEKVITTDQQLTVIDALNQKYITSFHSTFKKRPIKIVEPDGKTLEYEYDSVGRIVSIANSLGLKSKFVYSGNNISELLLPRGTALKFSYDENNNLKKYWDQNGDVTEYFYTELGQPARVVTANGENLQFSYKKSSGLLSKLIDQKGSVSQFYYDDLYRLKVQRQNGEVITRYTYNDEERTLKISGRNKNVWTKIAYNPIGRPEKIVSSDGKETSYNHDVQGRITQVTAPGDYKSELSYDSFGNLTNFKLPNSTEHKYQYDALNRLTKLINPQGNQLSYQYDSGNRLVEEKVDNLTSAKYKYDALGRLEKVLYDDEEVANYKYNLDNDIVEAFNGNVKKRIGRDLDTLSLAINIERPKSDATQNSIEDHNNYKVDWFADGTLKSIQYPSGMVVRYGYKKDGSLKNVIFQTPGEKNAQEITYSGAEKEGKLEVSYPNGVQTDYYAFQKDQQAYVSAVVTKDSKGKNLSQFQYEYDDNGNVSALAYQHGKEDPSFQLYGYDDHNQLTGTIQPNKGIAEVYLYDKNHNRTSKTIIRKNEKLEEEQVQFTEYQYDVDRLVNDGEQTYSYDAYGNIIKSIDSDGKETAYEYSPKGELKKVIKGNQVTEFYYDSLGNRTKRIVKNGTETQETYIDNVYGHRLGEFSENEKREYIFAPGTDDLLAVKITNLNQDEKNKANQPQLYFFHKDRKNSIILVTDQNGKAVHKYAYSAFGEDLKSDESKAFDNSFKYTGRYKEAAIDLYDYRTRFYNPAIGRFTTEDKYLAFAGTPQSYNRYTYVFNNPTRYTDPNGEFLNAVSAVVGAVAGGVIGGAIELGGQVISNGGFNNIDYGAVGFAAGKGAVVGGLAGFTGGASLAANGIGGVAVKVLSPAIGATVFDIAEKIGNGEPVTAGGVLADLGVNVAAGVIGGKIADKFKFGLKGRLPNWLLPGTLTSPNVDFSNLFANLARGAKNTLREIANRFIEEIVGGALGGIINDINAGISATLDAFRKLAGDNNLNPEDVDNAEDVSSEDPEDAEKVASEDGKDADGVAGEDGESADKVDGEEAQDAEDVTPGEGNTAEDVEQGEGQTGEGVGQGDAENAENVDQGQGQIADDVANVDTTNCAIDATGQCVQVDDATTCQTNANGNCVERLREAPTEDNACTTANGEICFRAPRRPTAPTIPPFVWRP